MEVVTGRQEFNKKNGFYKGFGLTRAWHKSPTPLLTLQNELFLLRAKMAPISDGRLRFHEPCEWSCSELSIANLV